MSEPIPTSPKAVPGTQIEKPIQVGIPYGDVHECVAGHLHAITPAKKACPKCGGEHTHPYYVKTSEGFQDCPKVPHITPAEVINKMRVPSKIVKKEKSEW